MSRYGSLYPRNDPRPPQSPSQFWAPVTATEETPGLFSSLYRGSSKSGKQKTPQGPFAFSPCAVNLPALQFLTTSGSRGFFSRGPASPPAAVPVNRPCSSIRAIQAAFSVCSGSASGAFASGQGLCPPRQCWSPARQRVERAPLAGGVLPRPWCGESRRLLLTDYCLSPEAFRTATLRLVMELKKTTSRAYNAALLLPLFLLFWGKCLSSVPDSHPATMQ